MPITYLAPVDLSKNELQNARVQNLAAAPSTPVTGQIYYDTAANTLYYYNGSTWVAAGGATSGVNSLAVDNASIENIGTAADPNIRVKALGITNAMLAGSIALAKLAVDPLARANHTGTQPASTVSDFDTQVRTSRLDQMAAPTAAVPLNAQRITGLADPTAAQDAATKAYTDAARAGLSVKDPVRVATTAAITLSGTQTIDGVAVIAGDRVLVKDQGSAPTNGVYVVAAGAWARATDADASAELPSGSSIFVSEGTANADTTYVLSTNAPIVLNTTALAFTLYSRAGAIEAGAGLTRTGTTIALTSPVAIANGGTAGTTAATARTGLGVRAAPQEFLLGDGSATAFVLTHNINSRAVVIQVYRNSGDYETLGTIAERTSVNTATIRFAVAPTVNQYAAVIS